MSQKVIEDIKKELGYSGMFADRDTVQEAMEYVVELGKGTNSPPTVTTAAMVLYNSLVKHLDENYILIRKDKEETKNESEESS